jgi:hypothetical protein
LLQRAITESTAARSLFAPNPLISSVLLAPQFNTCNFDFVLPGDSSCTINPPPNFVVNLTSPNFVFQGPVFVNCTGPELARIGICGGSTLDCNGFPVTNVGSPDTFLVFRGDAVKNCDVRGFGNLIIAPLANKSSFSNSKISDGNSGLQIGTGKFPTPATVTLKDVEVTNSVFGINVESSSITAAFDDVFSCGNSEYDVQLDMGSTIIKWDIICNEYVGFPGLDCPDTCPDVCLAK